jgi:predicted dehydrogenase/flavin reductase (DIM6/NTAB) family NADH-FMN oxidoreductase RutF
MRVAARTIWDTGIQNICGVVTAKFGDDIELWMTANFGQVSIKPPKLIINPNRTYPIIEAIEHTRCFAINVLQASFEDLARNIVALRMRSPGKTRTLNLPIEFDAHTGIPFIPQAQRIIFCNVEEILDTGDHAVTVASIMRVVVRQMSRPEMPLLFAQIRGPKRKFSTLATAVRWSVTATGVKDVVRSMVMRARPMPSPNIQRDTLLAGYTAKELDQLNRFGLKDLSRRISPPLPPSPVPRRVSVCVLGTGSWGSVHCDLFHRAGSNVDLSIAGRNETRTRQLAQRYRARSIIDIDVALSDPTIEAVSIVLPHALHAEVALKAAAAGKHILVEKPIALTLEDADRVIEASRGRVKLMVAENGHFRPQLRTAVELIDKGELGEPLYLQVNAGGEYAIKSGWKARREEMGGGILLDLGIHYIRSLRILMGEPDRVLATGSIQMNTKMEGEDSLLLLAESRFGWRACMLFNWAGPRAHVPDIVVAGTGGSLGLWPGRNHVELYPPGRGKISSFIDRIGLSSVIPTAMLGIRKSRRIRVPGSDSTGYDTEVAEFLAAIVEDRKPESPGEEGRRDLEIVLAGYRSLRTGAWVDVPGYLRESGSS